MTPSRSGKGNRLWVLTYGQIEAWTGLRLNSVRAYASRGEFDPRDIDSVLRWVNARRARRSLPLIGIPDEFQPPISADSPTVENSTEKPTIADEPEKHGEREGSPEKPNVHLGGDSGGYDPSTGEFQ